MPFSTTTTFSKPKSRRQPRTSDKWVDLQPRERKTPGLKKIGKKGEWWAFIGLIVNHFFNKIDLVDTCEIAEAGCDNYHRAWAHTRSRHDIRVGDWWYAVRVVRACQECHYLVDAQGRTLAESILEPIVTARFARMNLTEADVKRLLLECAAEVQKENPGKDGEPGKFDRYEVVFP